MKVITQEEEKKQILSLNLTEARVLSNVLSLPIWGGGKEGKCHSLTVKLDTGELIEVVLGEEDKAK